MHIITKMSILGWGASCQDDPSMCGIIVARGDSHRATYTWLDFGEGGNHLDDGSKQSK